MKLFPSLFQKNENLNPYQKFWKWFSENSDYFYKIVNSGKNIEENFFNKLAPELEKISNEIYFLTGMADNQTAELIFTPDGIIKKIYIVEELVAAAPNLSNWKFTALKPESKNSQFNLEMFGYTFGTNTMQFYSEPNSEYSDEINITLIHKDYKEENNGDFLHASYIFLDNYLGELNTVTQIDELKITDSIPDSNQSVPLTKLKEYLIWREKEFTEKYEGFWHNIENDNYSSFEGTLNNGKPLIAIINTSLLAWDSKASHPWIFRIEIDYEGDENGLPNQKTFEILNELEDEIMKQLKDSDGYLNLGRETAENCRDIFFACKEFRKPPKVLDEIIKNNKKNVKIDYKIYKDKYWSSMKRFEINS